MNNLVRGEMAGLADGFIEVRNEVATFRVPANRQVAVGERLAFVIAADWISIVTNGEEPRQSPWWPVQSWVSNSWDRRKQSSSRVVSVDVV